MKAVEKQSYRPDIDGLRAVAVLPVVLFHVFPRYLPGGFVGVDIFFVISGFLISSIIFEQLKAGTFSIVEFYARRVRRLFPALMIVLAAVFTVGWWLQFPEEFQRTGQQIVASAGFIANIYFWQHSNYFAPAANTYPLLHIWSLGVEEQFYVAWPLALLVLARRPEIHRTDDRSHIFWITCTQHHISWACCVLPTLHTRLGIDVGGRGGLVLPQLSPRRPSSEIFAIFGLALIAAAVIFLRETDSYPGWRALVPTTGTALIIWCGSTLLMSRALVLIGLISYPIYLWHWPAFWLARETGHLQNAGGIIVVVCAAIALAWLTFALVERPIRRGWRPTATFAPLMTSGIVVAIMGAAIAIDGVPGRWPAGLNALTSFKFDENAIYRIKRCHLLLDQRPEEFAPECFTNQQAGPTIVLWGDWLPPRFILAFRRSWARGTTLRN